MSEKEKIAEYNKLVVRLEKARADQAVIDNRINKIEKKMNALIEIMYD